MSMPLSMTATLTPRPALAEPPTCELFQASWTRTNSRSGSSCASGRKIAWYDALTTWGAERILDREVPFSLTDTALSAMSKEPVTRALGALDDSQRWKLLRVCARAALSD